MISETHRGVDRFLQVQQAWTVGVNNLKHFFDVVTLTHRLDVEE